MRCVLLVHDDTAGAPIDAVPRPECWLEAPEGVLVASLPGLSRRTTQPLPVGAQAQNWRVVEQLGEKCRQKLRWPACGCGSAWPLRCLDPAAVWRHPGSAVCACTDRTPPGPVISQDMKRQECTGSTSGAGWPMPIYSALLSQKEQSLYQLRSSPSQFGSVSMALVPG
jgi:hypothetical protein